jgi:hypothetical protein
MPDRPKYPVSPALAIGTAIVAIATSIVAIAMRANEPEPPAISRVEPPTATGMALPATAAEVAIPDVPPSIAGIKGRVEPTPTGLDLVLEVAVGMQAPAAKRDLLSIRARCFAGGKWHDGRGGSIALDKLGAGTTAVTTTLAFELQPSPAVTPAACNIGVEYYGQERRDRSLLAHVCWDGKGIVDKPCDPIQRDAALVQLSGIEVASSLDRMRTYSSGTPFSLDITVRGAMQSDERGWSLEVGADCKRPDGSTQKDQRKLTLSSLQAGVAFMKTTGVFVHAKLPVTPEACTVTLDVVDSRALVREPVDVRCWRDGTLADGACKA